MRRFLKQFGCALVGACLLAIPASAQAEGLTLKIEGGVAGATSSPQSDRFGIGGALALKPMIGLTPFLDIGPSVSLLALPSNVSGVDTGTALGLGGGLRLKRPRDASNTGTGLTAASPWAAGDLQYVRTDGLDRPSVTLTAGVQVPMSAARTVWAGPFVGYQDIVQGNRPSFDNTDAHVVMAGLSIEFGAGVKKKEEAKQEAPPPRLETPPPPQEVKKPTKYVDERLDLSLRFEGKVQFLVDSARILPSERATLDKVATSIKDELNGMLGASESWMLRVEGHASSEGPPEPYNQRLSERRAAAVVSYLQAHGVPADHLQAEGFSSTQPVGDNATKTGREQNRRVEFALKVTLVRKVKADK